MSKSEREAQLLVTLIYTPQRFDRLRLVSWNIRYLSIVEDIDRLSFPRPTRRNVHYHDDRDTVTFCWWEWGFIQSVVNAVGMAVLGANPKMESIGLKEIYFRAIDCPSIIDDRSMYPFGRFISTQSEQETWSPAAQTSMTSMDAARKRSPSTRDAGDNRTFVPSKRWRAASDATRDARVHISNESLPPETALAEALLQKQLPRTKDIVRAARSELDVYGTVTMLSHALAGKLDAIGDVLVHERKCRELAESQNADQERELADLRCRVVTLQVLLLKRQLTSSGVAGPSPRSKTNEEKSKLKALDEAQTPHTSLDQADVRMKPNHVMDTSEDGIRALAVAREVAAGVEGRLRGIDSEQDAKMRMQQQGDVQAALREALEELAAIVEQLGERVTVCQQFVAFGETMTADLTQLQQTVQSWGHQNDAFPVQLSRGTSDQGVLEQDIDTMLKLAGTISDVVKATDAEGDRLDERETQAGSDPTAVMLALQGRVKAMVLAETVRRAALQRDLEAARAARDEERVEKQLFAAAANHARQDAEKARHRCLEEERRRKEAEDHAASESHRRGELEMALDDLRREGEAPFVVPALLDAFVKLSAWTTQALEPEIDV